MYVSLPASNGASRKKPATTNRSASFFSKGVSDEYASEIASVAGVELDVAKSGILRARIAGVSDADIVRFVNAGFFSNESNDWGRWRSILHAALDDIDVMTYAEQAGIRGAELTEMTKSGAGAEEVRIIARLNQRTREEDKSAGRSKATTISAGALADKMRRERR